MERNRFKACFMSINDNIIDLTCFAVCDKHSTLSAFVPCFGKNIESGFIGVADLYIFGDIDSWGSCGEKDNPNRNASEIVSALRDLTAKNLNVHINSYGGDVKEGLAIYNTLRNSGKNVIFSRYLCMQ